MFRKAVFPVKKNWSILSRIAEHGKLQTVFREAAQGLLAIIVQVERSIL